MSTDPVQGGWRIFIPALNNHMQPFRLPKQLIRSTVVICILLAGSNLQAQIRDLESRFNDPPVRLVALDGT
jgi:hypothetical protein